jgi:predicted TIM-barrel fold metal-dependent hydrolase
VVDDDDVSRYIVVSGDSHAGPSLTLQLRQYCPQQYLDDFDDFVTAIAEVRYAEFAELSSPLERSRARTDLGLDALRHIMDCRGVQDAAARLEDMDDQGIAAEVIFSGGQNGEVLPWNGLGFGAANPKAIPLELQHLGGHIWNAWLADFIADAPDRLVGVMQTPIEDVDAAVKEVRWAHDAGLRVVNFPAPRPDFTAYNSDVYEPFWSVVEELGMPLACHSGAGDRALGSKERGGYSVHLMEIHWLGRRALWQMIFGGVFDRHPGLRLVHTEQRAAWVPSTVAEMDALFLSNNHHDPDLPRRVPSEYWAENCYCVASFMAPFEAEIRHGVGIDNLLWGSDYPHVEGTWPHTRLSMRNTFAGVPEPELRVILGDNGIKLYGLDAARLRAIADVIGPTPEELSHPVPPDEIPETASLAFRTRGIWA